MGILEDVMKTLERIPAWKRLQSMPDKVTELEARLAQLEERLKTGTGSKCPSCGAMAFKLIRSVPAQEPWGSLGAMEDHFACSQCSYTNTVHRDPGR